MKNRVIIVHGWSGYPEEGWFPWLKRELQQRGFTVDVPQLPKAATPNRKEWIAALTKVIGKPNRHTFLVGHSLGCYTILKYIERLRWFQRTGGAVLVAGFASLNILPLNNFYSAPLDWKRIKRHAGRITAINSTKDPYVPLAKGEELRDQLGAKHVVLDGYRHFSGHEGVKELPAALDAVLEITEP
ncbi:MAG: alpha/beta fold hydrolase [Patescibacteria group bacterium]|nr:alpha/beta fold hydrolase [Patescibacteria group bacterium]